MKLFHINKLDRRHSAYPYFSYYIQENVYRVARTTWTKAGVDSHKDKNFFTLREWFWTNFGASKEWRYWHDHNGINYGANRCQNPDWCWDTEFNKQRIYVTEQALTAFNLAWTNLTND